VIKAVIKIFYDKGYANKRDLYYFYTNIVSEYLEENDLFKIIFHKKMSFYNHNKLTQKILSKFLIYLHPEK